jgi:hypothetical protein
MPVAEIPATVPFPLLLQPASYVPQTFDYSTPAPGLPSVHDWIDVFRKYVRSRPSCAPPSMQVLSHIIADRCLDANVNPSDRSIPQFQSLAAIDPAVEPAGREVNATVIVAFYSCTALV